MDGKDRRVIIMFSLREQFISDYDDPYRFQSENLLKENKTCVCKL